MKRYQSALSVCGLALAAVCAIQPAMAATATASFNVTATVTATCSVSATDVAFGNVNPLAAAAATQTGTVTATCTNGTPYSISLAAGAGTFAQRTMSNGTSTLNYNLYAEAGHTNVLGDGSGSTVLITSGTTIGTGATGTGAAQAYTVYGNLPLPQAAATAGNYTDTINVTLNY